MTEQYLMERGAELMNVTPDKLEEYLQDGWKVLKTPQENKQPPVVDQEVPEEPDVPEVSEAPEEEEEAVSVETAVKTIGKRSRKKAK